MCPNLGAGAVTFCVRSVEPNDRKHTFAQAWTLCCVYCLCLICSAR